MDELFEEHLEIAKALFAQRLPYWCDVFLRPADRAFNAYLNARARPPPTWCSKASIRSIFLAAATSTPCARPPGPGRD